MYRFFENDPLEPLLIEYQKLIKEANLLVIINKKLAKQRFDKAQFLALQKLTLTYRN